MPRMKIKAIVPEHTPSTKEYTDAILGAFFKTVDLIESDLKSTAKTWDHKVDFRTVPSQGKHLTMTVGTDDKRYLWIDQGTGIYGPKKQTIKPKRSKYFRFQVGGRLKTRQDYIGSFPGSPSTQWITVAEIKGIPKRNFIKIIQKRRAVTMRQEISHAIAKVNRTQK